MELRENDISIMNRMRRTMPLMVLAERMTDVYQMYMTIYNDHYYSDCFNHFEDEVDATKECKVESEFIFETGFNYFIVIFTIMQSLNKANLDSE